ncbi:DUF881 domain-containing protein [Nocardioides sp. P86]|uniref:DUF881 domain-containing protein n=1 Tax=Nocardioides sp. P86 TaxID=2939569 RepID=UPI00203E0303|nr:DUF881 domain-containing protein [Nocardioides sp. P86]MCM3515192.1 DUF881 domain-containing protein [Nocardioides sp. P86]
MASRERPPAPTTPEEPRRPEQLPARVTMPLLTLITQQSLDEDYLHVAERRAEQRRAASLGAEPEAPPTRRGGGHRTAAVVVAVFGIMVATAALQTSRNADVDQAGRSTLIDQVLTARAGIADQQERISRLGDRIAAAEATTAALRADRVTEEARERRLAARTGYGAVEGEGVRITVSDPATGGVLVEDRDLRLLVNGLWQAGAEAVSINGNRLTVLSSILLSGTTVAIEGRDLRPPYVVSAIGDSRTLQADLAETASGALFAQVAAQYGFGVERQNVSSMTLPAARPRPLRSVEELVVTPPGPPRGEENVS